MSVVLSIEDAGPCRKRLEIEVPAAAVDAEASRVVAEIKRRVRLPGFRKGKVPTQVVRQRYWEEVRQEVIDRLVPRYWKQAADEKRVEPLAAPRVEDVRLGEIDDGGALGFTATVEVRPEIELSRLDGFELPELDVEPTREEVDRTIADLRREAGEWVPVERPAAEGDQVTAHLSEEVGEGAPPATQVVTVEIGDEEVWEELGRALTGRSADETVAFTRSGPGGERRFEATIAVVKERELPPLDDALARSLGDFDDLDALRRAVRQRVEAAKQRARRSARERALTEQLRQRNPLALPQGVVDEEIESLVRDYAEELERRGVDLERAGIDWQQVRGQARPQAERRVHDRLLLDAVAGELGIEVEPAEVEAAVAGIARAQGASTVAVRRALDRDGRLAALGRQLRRDKAVRRLLGEEPAPGEAEESDPQTGAEAPPTEEREA